MTERKISDNLSSINEELAELRLRTKNYNGDPFYEYRKKKILPAKFEYGMNCFLDRLLETEGKVVAQKTYEEILKKSRLST